MALFIISATKQGDIAQLGERLNGIQEVVGSIPIISTKSLKQGNHLAFLRTKIVHSSVSNRSFWFILNHIDRNFQ